MTLDHFEDALTAELAWRKKELLTCRLQLKASGRLVRPMQTRAGIVLLYAHWEGYVKGAGELLLSFVAEEDVPFHDLAPGMRSLALQAAFRSVMASESPYVRRDLVLATTSSESSRKSLTKARIETASNLSWRQFVKVAVQLEARIDDLGFFYRPLVDLRLVDARNQIAHGSRSAPIDQYEYDQLHGHVLSLLDAVRRRLLAVAMSGAYRL